ncbi:MAG: gliding motility-associated C-terminal domain-containing protein [Flavobacteriales bacterium]|nr:gliding motility-associated C-terminal domain-containing protein [Flavobacteriales bacterium]
MLKLRHIFFLCLSVVFSSSYSQNILHLCEGVGIENFKVPYLQGSFYQWQINGSLGVATIVGGNGTEEITIDIQSSGSFVLLVQETDSNGCNGTDSIQVIIHPLPQTDFSVSGNCLENPTIFSDNSYILTDSLVNYIWDFGDGEISAGTPTSHYYQSLGFYPVKLIVTSNFGCRDSITKNVQIFPKPIVDFSYNPLSASIINPIIDFTNQSISAIPTIWDFDDSTLSYKENPTHEFTYPGSFNVMLVASDSNNCVDSAEHIINIFYELLLYTPNSFSPNGDGDNDIFLPKGYRMNKYKSYQFMIYNRWGEVVFTTDNTANGWDGNNAKADVFTWVIILTDEMGAIRKQVGEVTLLK